MTRSKQREMPVEVNRHSKRMRVLAFPASGMAYVDAFYRAVEELGVEVVDGIFAGRWILAEARHGDIAHFHWPSFSYLRNGPALRLYLSFLRFCTLLIVLRLRGVRICWTAHNLMPHDAARWSWLDTATRRILILLSERIAVHGSTAAALLREKFPFPDNKQILIPLGHFADHYPVTADRATARERLSLPRDAKVVLLLGLCKPYKNVDGLIRTYRAAGLEALLLIAGSFPDPKFEAYCRELAGNSENIRIHGGFIDDSDMQYYLRAADVFVIPYREILTSGSAVLAASFGLPVVSIDKGFLRDYIKPTMGILYPPDSSDGLLTALRAALSRDWDEKVIIQEARQHRYEDAARLFIDSLRIV